MDDVFYVVRKLPHGLWEQLDMRGDWEEARERMKELRSESAETGAWDVWTVEQWGAMQVQKLTVDSFGAHAAEPPTTPENTTPEQTNQIAKRMGQLDESQVIAAVQLAVGRLESTAALYGTIRQEVLADQLCSMAVGIAHLMHQFPWEYVSELMHVAYHRYHEAMANAKRRAETRET